MNNNNNVHEEALKKYNVSYRICKIETQDIEVYAESVEAAKDKVDDMNSSGEIEFMDNYQEIDIEEVEEV